MKIPKPHLLPYDDDYVLVSKRRLVAGNHAVSSMALLLSGIFNTSHHSLIIKFTREAIEHIDSWSNSKVDSHIQTILKAYDQQANKNEHQTN